MLKHLTNTMLIGSSLMHLLCCGLPIVLSLSSVVAWAGVNVSLANEIELGGLHSYEIQIMVASGVLLLFTGIAQIVSRKLNCVKQSDCHHAPCAPKKNLSERIFMVASALWAVNLFHLLNY